MTQLFIQGKNVDLYEDETVNYNMKLADFTNFGTSSASYTNTFQVPATPKNNDLIRHYFNQSVSVSDSFNPRKRIPANIEVDSIPFQMGYVLLTKSTFKHEKPVSYSFTFYSNDNLVLAYLGDTTLKSLDWSEWNYDPADPFISNYGMSGTGNAMNGNNDVIFPLVQLINTDGTNKWTPDRLANWTVGDGGQDYTVLRPAIRVNKILDLIEDYLSEYGISFNYSGHSTENLEFFQSVYMYLPYEYVEEAGTPPGYNTALPISDFTEVPGYSADQVNVAQNRFNIVDMKGQEGMRSCSIELSLSAAPGYEYTVREYAADATGVFSLRSSTPIVASPPDNILYEYDRNDITEYVYFEIWALNVGSVGGNYDVFCSTSNDPTTNPILTGDGSFGGANLENPNTQFGIRVPETRIVDYVNYIFRMFNMVMYSNDGIEYFIAPWDDWRALGQTVNLSQYIDIGESSRGVNQIPQTFSFKYDDSESIVNVAFNNLFGYYYGNLIINTEGYAPNVDIDVGFNFALWENIGNETTNDDLLMFSCYDDKYDSITDEIFLFTWKEADIKNCDIYFLDWNPGPRLTTYKVASAFYGVDAPTYALTFKEEQNPYTNDIATVSLYDSFYSQYYGVLLDSNVRKFTYKGYVPNAIVSKLFPNDTVKLGNQYFFINKYQQNLTTQEISIELYNFQREADEPLPSLPDTTPPNMGVFTMDCVTNVLTWTAATDNVGVTGYKVYRNDVEIQDLNALTYTDSDKPTNQKNIYYIKAYDLAGNLSTPSNAIMCWGDIGFDYDLNSQMS